jgi:outer membrane lipopolysaccharide assembly protein LptE/RlpB
MKRLIPALLATLMLATLLSNCGFYHSTSRGRTLSGTINVPFLDNRTSQPDLELRATEYLIEAIENDGGLSLVSSGDEKFLLKGSVLRYGESPFSITDAGTADEYKLTIVLQLSFEDRELGEMVWSDRKFTGSESFFLEGSEFGAELTRDRAEEKAMEQIMDAVLNSIFGEW